MAFLDSQAGGTLFNFDAKTREAFAFAKKMIDVGAFPKNALTWNYDQENAAYLKDKLITMRQWNFFESVAQGTPKWFKRAKAEIVLPPAGPAGRGTWASTWGWGIPKASGKKDEAREFIKFIASPKNAPLLAKVNSYYAQPRHSIIRALPNDYFIKAMGAYSKAGVVKGRPFNPKVGQAQAVVDTVVTAYLTGQTSLDGAMRTGRKQIKQL
jgi:ABC-type glycerol-3-phosphate transport system substrate-binding protein